MDQARQWNPFIKLLVKHKISNLILFLISFTVGTDGDRNWGLVVVGGGGGGGGMVTREREAVDAAVISNGFITQN